jgi:hypothetical protein
VIEQTASVHHILCKSRKKCEVDPVMIIQRSGKKAYAIRWCSGQTERGETGKEQIQELAHNFI